MGGSHAKKRGNHQEKKFFINNTVEAQIVFNEEHQGLLKMQVSLGCEWERMGLFPREGTSKWVLVGGLLWLGWTHWENRAGCVGSYGRNMTAREPPWQQNGLPPIVNIMRTALAKSKSAMGSCMTISYTCFPCLPGK